MNKKFMILVSCYIVIIAIFIYVGVNLTKEINEKTSEILKLKEKVEGNNFKILELEAEIEGRILDLDNKDKELNVLSEENQKLKEDLKKYEDLKKFNVTATAYTSYCEGCSGFTKNETDVRNTIYKNGLRVVAVDNKVIPLNSILFVETKNEKFFAIADDIGGAIKGRKIDVLVPNKSIAKEFGRQHDVKVTIIKEG